MGTRRGRFVERTITGALSFIKESIFADEYASSRGFLQARDPRLKAAAIFALLLAVLLSREIAPIACIYALCLLLAAVSSIGIPYFLKRTWFFVPLFSLCIAAPALFSIFTPGEALISVTIFSFNIAITKQGVAGAGIFFLRILTSVSLCVLLSLTTRHQRLLGALRAFRVPQVFVMTLGMCHRYVYSFIELIQNSHLAIKSRSGGSASPPWGSGWSRGISPPSGGGLASFHILSWRRTLGCMGRWASTGRRIRLRAVQAILANKTGY